MFTELAFTVKYILQRDRAGRSLTVFPDDTFIVSFPRSGNTWTRFLVANLVYPRESVTFANIESLIPDIYAQSRRYLKRISRPRILKSHEYFDPRYKRVLYLVRDPRDVVLSSYYFHLKQRQIEEQYPIRNYVSRFVAGTSSEGYASWGENVISWLATRPSSWRDNNSRGLGEPWGPCSENALCMREYSDDFLLLRYEDLLADTPGALAKIADFLHIPESAERFARAAELSSACRMREWESKENNIWVTTKATREDIPFVRTARSGAWRSDLPESCIREIESAWAPLMRSLGYEPHCKDFKMIPKGVLSLSPTASQP
jgi:hypothetical protein